MIPIIADHLPEIRALCREYGVARLELFGSAATDAFDPKPPTSTSSLNTHLATTSAPGSHGFSTSKRLSPTSSAARSISS